MASALALSPTLLPLSRHRRSIFSPAAQIPLLSSIPRPHLLRGIVSLPLVPSGRVLWRVRAESTKQEREPMVPPFNVLITGSTKGIGLAFAKEFLKAGDNVVVCSRSAERVELTIKQLTEEFGEKHVWGTVCDVRKGEDVKALITFARDKLNYIDIWINNAGSNAYSYKPLAETADDDLMEVVTTNTIGVMICCREAINMMLNQPRGGHIFNIDGAGSDGRPTPRFAAYGATKQSVVHLTKSLQVAEYLVPSIRSVPSRQSMRPTYIRFLTGLKAYSQIFSRLAFGARRNRYVIED
ncbi:chlorophyll(ide) b reductase NOL, chloroplastic isoform X2 [Dioscorea cayenensis subsp. rotundata]|uniref:Chlorophyll(Ide) b reductase NOL, chloroplastic isoform X2 n=1 Tax=Dioscorea cayennensis subsp. rotundata TaxID=55577 RepID=A0AB40C221_DIOCR|nr:chlorophyll(ide) b reductase NOL, chloroplastic isoform X2 [Dioscorea cayenensis subsp. rotundata]